MIRLRLFLVVALLLLAPTLTAAGVPSPEEFLGYPLGSKFTRHHRVIDYFEALERSSELVDAEPYGTTPEGRSLIRVVVASKKHRASLGAIREQLASLQDPRRLTREQAVAISESVPAVALLAFGVHGDETSSTECAMKLAHWLVTSADAGPILESLVVVIDPVQNPDGRDHYVDWFSRASGSIANPDPAAIEHKAPWESGRANHYHIDMNRDWVWGTQAETRARIALFRQWSPQLFVDYHEMGAHGVEYFFPPVADPVNVNIPAGAREWLHRFGRANGEAFSQRGWLFFVGEHFDLFYPGYGDAWPTLRGAIGMTYEVAGGRTAGTIVAREGGPPLTLRDRIERHFTASTTTLRTAAENRSALILSNYDTLAAPLRAAPSVFLLDSAAPGARLVTDVLGRQGVEVEQLSAELTAKAKRIDKPAEETRRFPAGTIVVSTAQPLGGLVRTMLERSSAIDKSFLDEQRKLVESDEGDQFYDITAWSLPLAAGVPAWELAGGKKPATEPWSEPALVAPASSRLGWAVSGLDPSVYKVVGMMLGRAIRFAVSAAEIKVGSSTLPRGSVFVHRGINEGAGFKEAFRAIVADAGARAVPIDSFWTEGLALGSSRVQAIRDPKIAIAAGDGVDRYSLGPVWFQLDVIDSVPHTLVRADALGSLDLSKFRVLVLPDGKYELGEKGTERLKAWVEDGGTVVAIKGANEALRAKEVELSKLEEWKASEEKKEEDAERETKIRVPGAAFRTEMSERSYLTFGLVEPPAVLIEGSLALRPLPRKAGNVVRIAAKDALLSGVAWPESIERLQGAPYLTIESQGRGKVITFADDPNFRLFWRSTYPLLMNAMLYSPSFRE
ncbi:MAG: M14 family metallopeptidase [Thermoanaerobaculia bacterium]|nr:M14 family metallopeptidase [Thermoanaerobaculia bacterium]